MNNMTRIGTAVGFALYLSSQAVYAGENPASQKAQEFYTSGEYKKAIIEFKNALQKEPENMAIKQSLGKTYSFIGMLLLAEKELGKVAKSIPALPTAKLEYAKVLMQLKKYEEVEQTLKGSHSWLTENKAEALALMTQAYIYMDNYEQVKSTFTQAQQLSANNIEVVLTKAIMDAKELDITSSMQWLEQVLKQNPNEIRALLLKAELYNYQTQYKEAIKLFRQVSAQQFANSEVKLDLARIHLMVKEYDPALVEVDKVLKVSKNHVLANYLKAFILFKKKEYATASKYAEHVVKYSVGHTGTNFILAVISFDAKEYEKANFHIKKVTFAEPKNAPALKLQASILLQLGAVNEAMASLAQIDQQAFNKSDTPLMLAAAEVSLKNANYEFSRYLLDQAAEHIDSEDVDLKLAKISMAQGDTDDGIGHLMDAVSKSPESDEIKISLIKGYIKNSELSEALGLAKQMVDDNPDSVAGYVILGLVYRFQKKYPEAKQAYQDALQIDSNNIDAIQSLAILAQKDEDKRKAYTLHEQVLAIDPDNLKSIISLVELDGRRGNREQALARLEEAVEKHPVHFIPNMLLAQTYLARGRGQDALNLIEGLQGKVPAISRYFEFLSGLGYKLLGKNSKAIDIFNHLLEQDTESVLFQYHLASLYKDDGQLELAKESIDKVLVASPEHIPSLIIKGQVAFRQGDIDTTKSVVEKLEKTGESSADIDELRAQVKLVTKEFDEAISLYIRALKVKPSHSLNAQYVMALWLIKEKRTAIDVASNWLKVYPDNLLNRKILASFYMKQGELSKAQLNFEKLVVQDPENPLFLNNLAWIYLQTGNSKAALPMAKKARRLAPENPEVMDTLGMIFLAQGESLAAEKLLTNAVEIKPQDPNIKYHMAKAVAQNGYKEKAKQILRDLLELNRPFSTMKESRLLLKKLESSKG